MDNILGYELSDEGSIPSRPTIITVIKPDRAKPQMLRDTCDGIHPNYSAFKNYLRNKMKKQRYLIDYENAHWCGGQLNVVVWARNEYEAVSLAEVHMEETQRESFSSEYNDCDEYEEGDDDKYNPYDYECAYSVNSVELFNEDHEEWEFYVDPGQSSFYPEIGEEDD